MADSNSKIGNALLILIIAVAGYQAITHLGNYFASEVFKVPEVNFWSVLFMIVMGIAILVGGIGFSEILKR